VIVSNSPYSAGPAPVPDDPGDSEIVHHAFWEPYQNTAPQQGQSAAPASQPATFPYTWNTPNAFIGYRSSKAKIDHFNAAIQFTKQYVNDNRPDIASRVTVFDFWSHFDPGGNFNEYVCPPPNDASVVPDPILHQCVITNPAPGVVNAILARQPGEDLHVTSAGHFGILQPYLEPVVCQMLGKNPPNGSGCT
jgi:hypothetical protein